jgi:hypothetical protein
MARIASLYNAVTRSRPLIRLALLSIGLLTLAFGGAAPDCLPNDWNC